MTLTHKIRLYPTIKQTILLSKSCGVSRFTYNWALAKWNELYEAGEKPSSLSLAKQFNAIKREEFPWITEVTKCAPERAFANLGNAFISFFKTKKGYPKFKKKGKKDSYYVSNDRIIFDNYKIRLPKIGWVRLAEKLRFNGKIMSGVVSRTADKWFISVAVEMPDKIFNQVENQDSIGVDLGIKELAVCSNGTVFPTIKPLRKRLKKLRRLSKSLSRKVKGSNNRKKAKTKLSSFHYKISCLRKDYLDKITTYLSRNFKYISIEDLNVSGLMKNKKLSRAISDIGWSKFRRQLEYKTKLYGSNLITIDRFFPSSKMCSECGQIKDSLSLSERTFSCECGLEIDRDLNAAININTVGLTEINACGDHIRLSNEVSCDTGLESEVIEAGIKSCTQLYAS